MPIPYLSLYEIDKLDQQHEDRGTIPRGKKSKASHELCCPDIYSKKKKKEDGQGHSDAITEMLWPAPAIPPGIPPARGTAGTS